MINIQPKNEQSLMSIVSNFLLSLFTNIFKKDPKVIKAKEEIRVEKAENKQKAQDVRRDFKIEKRIDEAKKAFPASKLKVGKLIYIKYPGERKFTKETFLGLTDTHVLTLGKGQERKHPYGRVYSWSGKPIYKDT